jgi:hypothetical protein
MNAMLAALSRYPRQALLYGLFAFAIGYFATAPAVVSLPADQALIKVSFSHAGRTVGECRQRNAAQLAELAPNMRAPVECPRERSPVVFELDLDGRTIYRAELPPAGLARDGASSMYRRFPVDAGRHVLRARLKDDVHIDDFNHERAAEVVLSVGQVFVVDFNLRAGGFIFK